MCFDVFLCSILGVLGSAGVVAVRQMCVVGCFLVLVGFVVFCGFVVVARSVFMMFGCLRVMMGCFL